MRLRTIGVLVLLFACFSGLATAQSSSPSETPAVSAYNPVKDYDPKRDATNDVAEALKEAQRTNKNVLLEIGGKWCIWCRYFDEFFSKNTALAQYRDANYVMVKVNFSPENKNEALISQYGKVPGYPHIFVLDKNGKLLHSQHTSELEQGRGYNTAAVDSSSRSGPPRQQRINWPHKSKSPALGGAFCIPDSTSRRAARHRTAA